MIHLLKVISYRFKKNDFLLHISFISTLIDFIVSKTVLLHNSYLSTLMILIIL